MSETYFKNLSAEQKKNIEFIVNRMKQKGIVNPYTQTAILAVVSKESGFVPKSETSYRNTSNAQIRKIFGDRVAKFNDAELSALKKDDVRFFNTVYGLPKYGQTYDQGYKYRGRGLNQVTFLGNYRKMGQLSGYDLVGNPDLLNRLDVATDVLIAYFKNAFANASQEELGRYNTKDINGFTNLKDSLGAVYHANAGFKKPIRVIERDVTGGKAKAESRSTGFFEIVKNLAKAGVENVQQKIEEVKKKDLRTAAVVTVTLVSAFILWSVIKKTKT